VAIKLQPRDIQIMKFAFACRAVTYDQIVRRHFQGIRTKTAWRRIRRLADSRFFKISVIDVRGKSARVVQPLPSIWPVICEKWPIAMDTPHFKSESLEHDARMTEVYLRLQKLSCYRSFFTENMLQSSLALAEDPRFQDAVKIQSDGVLTIADAKGNLRIYAVELELSKKSPDRCREKLTDYYLARGIDGVLYVSPEREVERLITRIDEEIRSGRDSIVHFAYEEIVFSESSKITFTNPEGGIIELR
jgi:hypothetical protein